MWGSRYLQVFNRGSKSNDNPSSAIVNRQLWSGPPARNAGFQPVLFEFSWDGGRSPPLWEDGALNQPPKGAIDNSLGRKPWEDSGFNQPRYGAKERCRNTRALTP